MLEILLSALLTGVSASISTYLVARYMKNSIKDEIFDFFESQEGMNFVASAGKLFAAGAMSVMKLSPKQQNMNIFGMKIPTAVVMAVLEKAGIMKGIGEEIKKQIGGNLKLG